MAAVYFVSDLHILESKYVTAARSTPGFTSGSADLIGDVPVPTCRKCPEKNKIKSPLSLSQGFNFTFFFN